MRTPRYSNTTRSLVTVNTHHGEVRDDVLRAGEETQGATNGERRGEIRMAETNIAEPEQAVHEYKAWVNGDSSKVDVLSESVDVYNPGLPDGEVHSRAAYEAYLQEVRTGFPDFQLTEEEVVSSGDVVMAEFTITGTHEGEFQGLPPTGREVEIRGVETFRVADGNVVECHVYYDTRELADQLGLTFPTVIGQLPTLARGKLRAIL